ncbi:hypothetical protein [Acinetobacter sp. ANC 4805]|uniref:hypothetical protein n=1 Tax=Acinetobacter sp. ANC 4805 TaxID=2923425 RepID=UPI001A1C993E|nr:hypothetical protein [Acinetobacter sp. ANC 4805]MBH2002724.1 hypothetical protein [Moraxellaceae bacterium]MBH2030123.1 hypothetical protein [Moraxellaceae bacterium]MCH7312423.1 hypothetical protein [Acinetobacter sp. ANC 4805]
MRLQFAAITLTAITLTGCATLKPMELQPEFWQQSNKKVAVVVYELPKTAAYKAGNQGLLDIAINNAISNKFDNFVSSLQFEPYSALAEDIEKEFDQRGFDATVVKVDVKNVPTLVKTPEQKKNPAIFQMNLAAVSELKDKDLVFIITSTQVGTTRSYYSVVPTSAPQGIYGGIAHLVDVKTNEIKWWKPVSVIKPVNGDWDQPPSYPNVSQAVDLAIEASKQEYKKQLFNNKTPNTAITN